MRNIVCHAIILGMVSSSLTSAEYSGSSGSSNGGYGKSGYDSSFGGGYSSVGEYAGQLGVGKAIGELHNYGESQIAPEHGSQYDDGESRYNDDYEQQGDSGHKFSSGHYDGYSENLDTSKFPLDVEAHHYTGGRGSSDIGIEDEEHHQEEEQQQQYRGHHDYQSDDDGDQTIKQHIRPYNSYERPGKATPYAGYQDHVGMQIVPYSGHEEAEQNGEQYSGYENSEHSYNQIYEDPKEPEPSYSPSYESPKAPSASYSTSYEPPKAASPTYTPSYEPAKTASPSHANDYSSGSYGSHYQHSSDSASKSLDIIQKIKGAGLKNFHTSLQKNIMTIDHGKGSFSYSSLYRS